MLLSHLFGSQALPTEAFPAPCPQSRYHQDLSCLLMWDLMLFSESLDLVHLSYRLRLSEGGLHRFILSSTTITSNFRSSLATDAAYKDSVFDPNRPRRQLLSYGFTTRTLGDCKETPSVMTGHK